MWAEPDRHIAAFIFPDARVPQSLACPVPMHVLLHYDQCCPTRPVPGSRLLTPVNAISRLKMHPVPTRASAETAPPRVFAWPKQTSSLLPARRQLVRERRVHW